MNLEKNIETNTEKFTENNTENFFCIFSVNFFVFFFLYFFPNSTKKLNLPIFLNIWATYGSNIETNSRSRLQEPHFWILEKNMEKIRKNLQKKNTEKFFRIFFCKYFRIFFRIFFQNPKTRLLQPSTSFVSIFEPYVAQILKKIGWLSFLFEFGKKYRKKYGKIYWKKYRKIFLYFFL